MSAAQNRSLSIASFLPLARMAEIMEVNDDAHLELWNRDMTETQAKTEFR